MGVVAILFAAIDKMVCGRIVCHESEWIFITGIRQFTSLQNADDGYAEIVNLWIELQPIIGLSPHHHCSAGACSPDTNPAMGGLPIV